MGVKSKNIKVSYYDCDKDSKLRPSSILRYFAEVSTRDEDRGFKNLEKMDKMGYGWMLAKWRVSIESYPKTGEEIIVRTWVSEINKFYVHREYSIEDLNGNELIKGSGLWIFIDINKRKLIRVTDEYFNMNYIIEKKNFEGYTDFSEDINYTIESELEVRRSDIDANQHVNNIKYLDWIIESIPEYIYIGYTISEFDIQYKKEIKYPAEVIINSFVEENNEKIEIIHGILEKTNSKTNSFIKSIWKKK